MSNRKWTFYFERMGACSQNKAFTYEKKYTTATHQWVYELKVAMIMQSKKIREIKEIYVATEHFLTIDYFWFLDEGKMFMKDKSSKRQRLSERAGDVGNFAKIPDDYILNIALGIDDSNLCKESIWKLPNRYNGDHFKAIIAIYPLSLLYTKSDKEFPKFWN